MNEAKAERKKNRDLKITAETVLFFDLDGTLVDTNYSNFLAYKKAIQSVAKLNNDLIYNPNKRFNRSNLRNAVPNLTETEYERIIQEKEKYYDDFLHETKLNAETADILFNYSDTNKTVLVSNCREDRAMTTVKPRLSVVFRRTTTEANDNPDCVWYLENNSPWLKNVCVLIQTPAR